MKSLQAEIIASINTSTSFVKEVTDFYDSQDKLVKTQMKVSDNSGNMRTYTTSYSKDKDGNATAWTSHIDTQKFTNQSKEELEVQKQITAEIEAQSKANQKKYQEFQREEQAYQKEQNQIAYDKLTETIRQYSEVAKRVSSGRAEDGDLQKMTQLEEKISQLQKQPILSESQVAKSESFLNNLYDQLDKIEKKLQETNQQKVGNGLEKLSTYRGKSDKYSDTLKKFNDGGWASDEYIKNVNTVSEALKTYQAALQDVGTHELITSKDIDLLDKYEAELKQATGVDIMADEDTFKSTAEIIKEIGAVWDQMTDVSQAATLEKLAGKNRASTVAGLIENYKTIDKVIEAASNADNSALEENQKIIDSIDGKIQKLQNRVQEFWYNAIDDSTVKTTVSILTFLVETGTKLVDIFGVMPPIFASIFAFIGKDKSQQRFCPSW